MLASTQTVTLEGIAARLRQVEVNIRPGEPSFTMSGLPDSAVRECRERLHAALVYGGFEYPFEEISVKLTPEVSRKAAPAADLAIAAALLAASGQIECGQLPQIAFVGELALDGSIRPVPGILLVAKAAREKGVEMLVVPADCVADAALISDLRVAGVGSVAELPELLSGSGGQLDAAQADMSPLRRRILDLYKKDEGPPTNLLQLYEDLGGSAGAVTAGQIAFELRRLREAKLIPPDGGEVRGELDPSGNRPIYAVQHCVVDLSNGQIVVSPSENEDLANEVAARLNQAIEPPSSGEGAHE